MGAAIATMMGPVPEVLEDMADTKENRAKLLRKIEKYRHLRLESCKQFLMMKEKDENMITIPGGTGFKLEFQKINDLYGDKRLNLESCYQENASPGSSFACMRILRHLIAIQTKSVKDMAFMRALGRHHAILGKQDRIRLLFDIMLRTISSRLGSQVQHDVMDAWRFHFDIIYVEMTRDKIRLYPELHSARISSSRCSSASGYSSCGEEEQQLLLQIHKNDEDCDDGHGDIDGDEYNNQGVNILQSAFCLDDCVDEGECGERARVAKRSIKFIALPHDAAAGTSISATDSTTPGSATTSTTSTTAATAAVTLSSPTSASTSVSPSPLSSATSSDKFPDSVTSPSLIPIPPMYRDSLLTQQ